MRRIRSRCCARAASGHAVAVLPKSVMKSRLRMGPPTLATLREGEYRIGGNQSGAARLHYATRRDPRRQMWVIADIPHGLTGVRFALKSRRRSRPPSFQLRANRRHQHNYSITSSCDNTLALRPGTSSSPCRSEVNCPAHVPVAGLFVGRQPNSDYPVSELTTVNLALPRGRTTTRKGNSADRAGSGSIAQTRPETTSIMPALFRPVTVTGCLSCLQRFTFAKSLARICNSTGFRTRSSCGPPPLSKCNG